MESVFLALINRYKKINSNINNNKNDNKDNKIKEIIIIMTMI